MTVAGRLRQSVCWQATAQGLLCTALFAAVGITQDGGGVTKDGGLPPAPVLSVSGERELVHELERIIDSLNKGTEVDWEKR